ncbi:MAG: HAMP domain-containing histidine kinase [Lachnospiraceae bacterium]|nr:HAMP domain-containing histidine kinase [Lachnospiraceae bacterium]
MNEYLMGLAFLMAAGALAYAIYDRHRNKKILDHVEELLDDAIRGSFREGAFSEDRVSRIESKLADYLQSSALSAENVRRDRDQIKTLIADISHQTKTPITNLLLHSELLQETELSAEQRESLNAIGNEAEKLRFLVDALVKLSRLENGILSLDPKKDDVGRLLKETEAAMRKKAEAKGLTFSVEEGHAEASFDYKWTLEALGNIVDNAIKYTEKGGITLSVSTTEMFVCIHVKDTGMGIPEEDIPKIFARFGRLPSSREQEGVGIGLYLAREILSKEEGYIKVKSRPGEGSEFRICLKR